jgi:hypothetical protein
MSNCNREELDREQLAIIENRERGLGLMGEWQGDQDWFGGQIQQLARLVKSNGSYMIHLEPLEKRRSHRFARYLGSRRMIQLRIPDELVMKELPGVRAYLSHKFVLCGRVFVSLHAKDNSVYMVETNEDYERQPGSWCGDEYRRTFADVIEWHNPLDLNKNQVHLLLPSMFLHDLMTLFSPSASGPLVLPSGCQTRFQFLSSKRPTFIISMIYVRGSSLLHAYL